MSNQKAPPLPIVIDNDGEVEVISLEITPFKETNDDFVKLLKSIIYTNVKNIPNFISENMLWLLPLLIAWTFLESISNFRIMTLPKPISTLVKTLIFITSTYNNFLAKGLYLIAINRSIIPTIKSIKSEGISSIYTRYLKTIGLIKESYISLKDKSLSVILASVGFSFIVSNILTRNNKIDKYFISLLTAFTLLNSLYRGYGDVFVRLFRAFLRKLSKNTSIGHHFIFLSIGSMSLGFVSSIIFTFIRFTNSYYDYTGYVIGSVLFAVGIFMNLRGKKLGQK